MSFFDAISNYFGLSGEPTKGKWPRKLESWERPPPRIPILPPHLRPPLPPGLREVTGPGHQGWRPWGKPEPRAADSMHDYLQNGFVVPPKKDGL
jgi:hypothetical protein